MFNSALCQSLPLVREIGKPAEHGKSVWFSIGCVTENGLIELEAGYGAHARIRTGDLFLTKEMLYRLSYVGGLRPILSAT